MRQQRMKRHKTNQTGRRRHTYNRNSRCTQQSAHRACREHERRGERQIRAMMDSYVRVMSTAIDARTPYNANHTKNMVRYAQRFIAWVNTQPGALHFDRNQTQEFLMSVWMHDIGKLITPLAIMDKQDRLADNYDRIMERLEKIRLLTRIEALEGRMDQAQASERIEQTHEAAEMIRRINRIPYLTDELAAEVEQLAARTFVEEDGSVCGWLTAEEREQLMIRRGTLTAAERAVMQDHAKKTRLMLEQMVFGDDYRHVLTWASNHHELLDGSGYPQGLTAEEISPEVRLLTILDIFEAMTAVDRPYKKPIPVETAFRHLHRMAGLGEIDETLLGLFERSRAWEQTEDESL